jgi:IS5 family transposase
MKQMNQLCIEMTHAGRRKDSRKVRKTVLRRMKKLSRVVSLHAQRHRDLLLEKREQTGWSEAQAEQVLGRIRNVLDQLPAAIHQAHERLIGERKLANSDKILSLYEPDVHVIVRGKAGAAVEFGNGLYLAEQAQGLIVDWEFIRAQPPSDGALVKESLERIQSNYGKPQGFAADRGFHSKANSTRLEAAGIFDAICPRSVRELRERLLQDGRFARMQTRRASTEARIAILTNNYVGSPLRSKGFVNRKIRIEWCILAHNLWKLAAMAAERRRELLEAQAA